MSKPTTNIKAQETQIDLIVRCKELLADPRYHIELYDFTVQELRKVIDSMIDPNFAPTEQLFDITEFTSRIAKYETISKNLCVIGSCIAYWGEEVHRNILSLAHSRITDPIQNIGGTTVWLLLRWYPTILMVYSTGVAALAAKNYANLAAVFTTNVSDPDNSHGRIPFVHAVGKILLEMNQTECFKYLPGREQQIHPREEYLYGLLQPELDSLLFLGRGYEEYFAQFEIFLALAHGHFYKQANCHFWTPTGRFAGRAWYGNDQDPFQRIIKEAEAQRDEWMPIRTGLFPASYERFEEIAEDMKELMKRRSF